MIYNDNPYAFDAIVYGEKHPANLEFFRQQTQNITSTMQDAGKSFFSNLSELNERFNGSEAMRLGKAAIRAAKSIFQPNIISSIFDIGGMQQAPTVMQRWIMANPTVRELYHNQGCDGYADSYTDHHPGTIGESHYDYRRATEGMVQIDEANDAWFVKLYPDDLYEGDKNLSHDEKVDIFNTWDIIEMFVNAGKVDPTSVTNSNL